MSAVTMPVLSLLQPWASFVIWGLKTWETRSRNIGLPLGQLLIHASQRKDPRGREVYDRVLGSGIDSVRKLAIPGWDNLIRGAVIGGVFVRSTMTGFQPRAISEIEAMLGDFSAGRYFVKLESPVEFNHPIQLPGRLGVWKLNIEMQLGKTERSCE